MPPIDILFQRRDRSRKTIRKEEAARVFVGERSAVRISGLAAVGGGGGRRRSKNSKLGNNFLYYSIFRESDYGLTTVHECKRSEEGYYMRIPVCRYIIMISRYTLDPFRLLQDTVSDFWLCCFALKENFLWFLSNLKVPSKFRVILKLLLHYGQH